MSGGCLSLHVALCCTGNLFRMKPNLGSSNHVTLHTFLGLGLKLSLSCIKILVFFENMNIKDILQ